MNHLSSRRIRAELSRRQIHLLSPVRWHRITDCGSVAEYRWADVEKELVCDFGWTKSDAEAFLMDCFLAEAVRKNLKINDDTADRMAA